MKRLNKMAIMVGIAGLLVAFGISGRPSSVLAETPAPAVQKKAPKYIGNSDSKKYHLASCKLVQQMKPENQVDFATKADAKKAGYEPCKICLPPSQTGSNPGAASPAKPSK